MDSVGTSHMETHFGDCGNLMWEKISVDASERMPFNGESRNDLHRPHSSAAVEMKFCSSSRLEPLPVTTKKTTWQNSDEEVMVSEKQMCNREGNVNNNTKTLVDVPSEDDEVSNADRQNNANSTCVESAMTVSMDVTSGLIGASYNKEDMDEITSNTDQAEYAFSDSEIKSKPICGHNQLEDDADAEEEFETIDDDEDEEMSNKTLDMGHQRCNTINEVSEEESVNELELYNTDDMRKSTANDKTIHQEDKFEHGTIVSEITSNNTISKGDSCENDNAIDLEMNGMENVNLSSAFQRLLKDGECTESIVSQSVDKFLAKLNNNESGSGNEEDDVARNMVKDEITYESVLSLNICKQKKSPQNAELCCDPQLAAHIHKNNEEARYQHTIRYDIPLQASTQRDTPPESCIIAPHRSVSTASRMFLQNNTSIISDAGTAEFPIVKFKNDAANEECNDCKYRELFHQTGDQTDQSQEYLDDDSTIHKNATDTISAEEKDEQLLRKCFHPSTEKINPSTRHKSVVTRMADRKNLEINGENERVSPNATYHELNLSQSSTPSRTQTRRRYSTTGGDWTSEYNKRCENSLQLLAADPLNMVLNLLDLTVDQLEHLKNLIDKSLDLKREIDRDPFVTAKYEDKKCQKGGTKINYSHRSSGYVAGGAGASDEKLSRRVSSISRYRSKHSNQHHERVERLLQSICHEKKHLLNEKASQAGQHPEKLLKEKTARPVDGNTSDADPLLLDRVTKQPMHTNFTITRQLKNKVKSTDENNYKFFVTSPHLSVAGDSKSPQHETPSLCSRSYTLDETDDVIKSLSNNDDRRMKSVETKSGCRVSLEGPLQPRKDQNGSLFYRKRYLLTIHAPTKMKLDKCYHILKETYNYSRFQTVNS